MTTSIHIELGSITPREAKALTAMLLSISGCPVLPASPLPAPEAEPQAEPVATDAKPEAEGEFTTERIGLEPPTKVRKPRAKKADETAPDAPASPETAAPAAEAPAPVVVPPVVPPVAPAAPEAPVALAPAATAGLAAPTFDEVRAAVKAYTKAKGVPAATELLADFGCVRASQVNDLPVAEQLDFVRLALVA